MPRAMKRSAKGYGNILKKTIVLCPSRSYYSSKKAIGTHLLLFAVVVLVSFPLLSLLLVIAIWVEAGEPLPLNDLLPLLGPGGGREVVSDHGAQ